MSPRALSTEYEVLVVRRFFVALLTLLIATVSISGAANAGAVQPLSLRTGTSQVLHLANLERVAVGDPDVLGTYPLPGKRELLINAKSPGRTTLYVWTTNGTEQQYEIVVTASDLDILAQMLRSTIGRSDVQLETFGHSIVLRGTVPDGAALAQIGDILTKFDPIAKQDQATIVNAVLVAHPLGDIQNGLSGAGLSGIRVDPDGAGNVIVSGRVRDETQRQSVLNQVKAFAGRYLSANGAVIDRLSTALTTQVDVKVYVLEIDDTGLSQIGINPQSATSVNGTIALGPPSFPIIESKSGASGSGSVWNPLSVGPFFRTTTLAPTIDLIQQEGHAKILSAPDLTTVPGENATFLVGGQIPIPQSSGLGSVSVQYQTYGVQLNLTPTLLGNGDVQTKISPEVSDLDPADGVTVNGFVIPALTTSRLSTNVITAPGESIIMGGMMRHLDQRTIYKWPFLSQIPILGKLFQDVRYQRSDANVVFVMTPYVITR